MTKKATVARQLLMQVRVNPAEKAKIERNAKRAKMTPAEWLRMQGMLAPDAAAKKAESLSIPAPRS